MNAIRAGTSHDPATSAPRPVPAEFPSEYGGHLALVAQAPAAEALLDAVRHAVLCTEQHDPHRLPVWWRQVVDAYRVAVPDTEGSHR